MFDDFAQQPANVNVPNTFKVGRGRTMMFGRLDVFNVSPAYNIFSIQCISGDVNSS